MRAVRVIYAIVLVLVAAGFVFSTAQLVRHIIPSDRHALEKLSHGLVVLAFAAMVFGLSHVLYTRRTHVDQRFYVVVMMLFAFRLLIEWVSGP